MMDSKACCCLAFMVQGTMTHELASSGSVALNEVEMPLTKLVVRRIGPPSLPADIVCPSMRSADGGNLLRLRGEGGHRTFSIRHSAARGRCRRRSCCVMLGSKKAFR